MYWRFSIATLIVCSRGVGSGSGVGSGAGAGAGTGAGAGSACGAGAALASLLLGELAAGWSCAGAS